ncbi:MAG: PH domain-containing protein [Candidatus Micrarchaeota archaeon]|nr:PH domain-containing protein [Candidatus Micrarchaeota archaeon]
MAIAEIPKKRAASSSTVKQKIKKPPHDYFRPPQVNWPTTKIMQKESELTYAPIHFLAQLIRAIWFLLITGIALILVFGIAISSAAPVPFWAVVVATIFLLLPWVISEAIEIRYLPDTYRFSLQEEFLFIRSGAIGAEYELIPYENIQDVQLSQELVAKIFGVASVAVSTPASTVFISFLNPKVARKFREDLLTLVKMHKGMAE